MSYRNNYGESDWQESAKEENEFKYLFYKRLGKYLHSQHGEIVKTSVSNAGTGSGSDIEVICMDNIPEAGMSDLVIKPKGAPEGHPARTYVECTGSRVRFRRPVKEYWVQKRKIEFVQRHPDWNAYVLLRYHHPEEKIIVIKPDPEKRYSFEWKNVRDAKEPMAIFNDSSPEILQGGLDALIEIIRNNLAKSVSDKDFPVIK